MVVAALIAESEFDTISQWSRHMRAGLREGEVVGFTHVEVQIDRIERNERRQQRRAAGAATATSDETADGNLMLADPAGEGRGDMRIVDVEFRIRQLSLGLRQSGCRRSLVGVALVNVLGGAEIGLP